MAAQRDRRDIGKGEIGPVNPTKEPKGFRGGNSTDNELREGRRRGAEP